DLSQPESKSSPVYRLVSRARLTSVTLSSSSAWAVSSARVRSPPWPLTEPGSESPDESSTSPPPFRVTVFVCGSKLVVVASRRGRGEHLRHRGGRARFRFALGVEDIIAQTVADFEAEALDVGFLEDGVDLLRDLRRHRSGVIHRRGGRGHLCAPGLRGRHGLDL